MLEERREMLGDAQRRFYYVGFRKVLQRYRYMTLAGWLIVMLAFFSLPLGWNLGLPHGFLDLLLSAGGILAGILVVQQAVMAVESYMNVPFPDGENPGPAVEEIRRLMKEIDEGGWWETNAGLKKLEAIASRYGFQDDDDRRIVRK